MASTGYWRRSGRDGFVQGPEDARLPAAPADLLLPNARAARPLIDLVVGTTLLSSASHVAGAPATSSPTTSHSTRRRSPNRTPSLQRTSLPTSPSCPTLCFEFLAVYCRDPPCSLATLHSIKGRTLAPVGPRPPRLFGYRVAAIGLPRAHRARPLQVVLLDRGCPAGARRAPGRRL